MYHFLKRENNLMLYSVFRPYAGVLRALFLVAGELQVGVAGNISSLSCFVVGMLPC